MTPNPSRRTRKARLGSRFTPPKSLLVVFDSSAIWTRSPCELVSTAIAEVVEKHSKHGDLPISWVLPDIVVREREYQMMGVVNDHLPSAAKLAGLIRPGVDLTSASLAVEVASAINAQLLAFAIERRTLSHEAVDWPSVIDSALKRQPPFEPGDKEKGFRDALVLETLSQVVDQSSRDSSGGHVVFVCKDGILADCAKARLGRRRTFRLVGSCEALEELVNAIVARVSDAYVQSLTPLAKDLFFQPNPERGLFVLADVRRRLETQFSAELRELPGGAEKRENDKMWYVYPPQFTTKQGSRVGWTSSVRVQSKAFRKAQFMDTLAAMSRVVLHTQARMDARRNGLPEPPLLTSSSTPDQDQVQTDSGETAFTVEWSATVSAEKVLSAATVDRLGSFGTTWTPVPVAQISQA